jgi:hypothetical protein
MSNLLSMSRARRPVAVADQQRDIFPNSGGAGSILGEGRLPGMSYFLAAVAAWTTFRSNGPLLSTKKTHSELGSQLVVWR